MAAPGRHVGRYIQRNGRFLTNNVENWWCHRSFGWTPALRQTAATATKESTEGIVVPRKKTWSKVAVLEALAATVSRDPTACNYHFQDDNYLSPRTTNEFKLYLLAKESGQEAAKYFINHNPKFFTKDFAEPHIPCFMPETVSPQIEELSEAALKERISLRKVTAAVDMYDQLLQSGTEVSMETIHDLLDLICLYGDKDPAQEEEEPPPPPAEDVEPPQERRKIILRQRPGAPKGTWKQDNNAERIFNLLPERDVRCYSALIRGMVKFGAHAKALSMYTDLLNERLTADVHIFNALMEAASHVYDRYMDRWDMVQSLLTQMTEQKVRPNLMTFNSVLRTLRRCGSFARSKAFLVLNEMKALGVEPSLATYEHILVIFYRGHGHAEGSNKVIGDILSELSGRSFTCQDPADVCFFATAIKVCLDTKDLKMGYKVQNLVEVGENWRLLGDPYRQSIYYGRFFSLLCALEYIGVVLKWYTQLVPSAYYPNTNGLKDLLQSLDTENRLDFLPQIWKDVKSMGHDNKLDLVDQLLTLMARDQHSPEVQERFAACALDIRDAFESERRRGLEWSTMALVNVTTLLLRVDKIQQAWEMLQLFKSNKRVPSDELMKHFLSVCQSKGSPRIAVDLVSLSADFFLPQTAELAKTALAEFNLTDEQRAILSELMSAAENSDE